MKNPTDVMVQESEFDDYGTVMTSSSSTCSPHSSVAPWCAGCGKVLTERSPGAFTVYGMNGVGQRYCNSSCRRAALDIERQKMRGVI